MRFIEFALVGVMLCAVSSAPAEILGSSSSTSDVTGSTGNSTDSSQSISDSSKPEPNKARKVIVPMRARDEAALLLVSEPSLPQSALLRSTLQAFRRVLEAEGKCRKKCTDAEVVLLLLARTEAPRGPR